MRINKINKKLNANDKDINNYLNILWKSNNNSYIYSFVYYYIYINIIYLIRLIYIYIFNKIYKNTIDYYIFYNQNNINNIGFTIYQDTIIEKELLCNFKKLNNYDKLLTYAYIKSYNIFRYIIMLSITSYCSKKNIIFDKYKGNGSEDNINNFRWLVEHINIIKFMDKKWCDDLLKDCGVIKKKKIKKNKKKDNNIIDNKIFICNIWKNFSNKNCAYWGCKNTKSLRNTILLDLKAAFDSIDYEILEKMLYNNLSKKMNKNKAKDYVDQYMIRIRNRTLYIRNSNIKQNYIKSIPTGLASSSLVFTLFIEEIIYNWLYINKSNFRLYIDFKLHIYIDDIYIKIINKSKTNKIIQTIIKAFNDCNLIINTNKSKADINLHLNHFKPLTSKDKYLGILFTRDKNQYHNDVLEEFNNKFNTKLNWKKILKILESNTKDNIKNSKKINGFMRYKLSPFIDKIKINNYIKNYIIDL